MCLRFIFTGKYSGMRNKCHCQWRRIKICRHVFVHVQISAKLVQGLPTWSSKCMHNSPKFSYQETRKNIISAVMRLAAPRRQANKVLIDKRKHQFSWTIVVWQVTGNRQIFAAVGNFLVEKKPIQERSNNLFLDVSKCWIVWLTPQILNTQQLLLIIFNFS